MIKYPKIQSLWKRKGGLYTKEELKTLTPEQKATRGDFITGEYACPEFKNINNFLVTEKIDGTNIRIICKKYYLEPSKQGNIRWTIDFKGRTDAAILPPKLLKYLEEHFTAERIENTFKDAEEVTLFGEGFGEKIQSGGYYSKDQRFCLFDVYINEKWWMEYDTVMDIACQLEIPYAPIIMPKGNHSKLWKEDQIIAYVKGSKDCPSSPLSQFAKVSQHQAEGVVARAYPMMLFRHGTPIKFKLKHKDFKNAS